MDIHSRGAIAPTPQADPENSTVEGYARPESTAVAPCIWGPSHEDTRSVRAYYRGHFQKRMMHSCSRRHSAGHKNAWHKTCNATCRCGMECLSIPVSCFNLVVSTLVEVGGCIGSSR